MGLNAFLDQERSYKICILVQSQVPTCYYKIREDTARRRYCKIQEFLSLGSLPGLRMAKYGNNEGANVLIRIFYARRVYKTLMHAQL